MKRDVNERFWAKVDKSGDCWLWTASTLKDGYGGFSLCDQQTVSAHRYAYEQLVGAIPEGLQIDHLCRVPACVNPAHMEAVTPATNVRRKSTTKLTAAQAAEIRESSEAPAVVARAYGVSPALVTNIRAGRRWKPQVMA